MISFTIIAVVASACAAPSQSAVAQAAPSSAWASTDAALGRTGAAQPGGVMKYSFPRSDLQVIAGGVLLKPAFALGSWVAFRPMAGGHSMVMGDLVLFQDEVNPTMSAALKSGLKVTALHNHFFFDDPKVYFMHIEGEGTTEALANAVKQSLDASKEIRSANPQPTKSFGKSIPNQNSITSASIETILGKGQSKDGMFKVVFGRKAKMPCGCEAGKEMGVNTWAAFAGTDDDAVVDGDFAVLESELQEVLKSLRKSVVNIVAIHHHISGEEPRVLFLHYWGRGKATDLANAVKTALATQNK